VVSLKKIDGDMCGCVQLLFLSKRSISMIRILPDTKLYGLVESG